MDGARSLHGLSGPRWDEPFVMAGHDFGILVNTRTRQQYNHRLPEQERQGRSVETVPRGHVCVGVMSV